MRGEITRDMFTCIPEIDFNSGYRYFLGNMDNYTKALLSILKSIKSKLPILQTMNQSEEYEGLRIITQTLRKMLGNIGAEELAEHTYQLEATVLNNELDKVKTQLQQYIVLLLEFAEHLEILLKKMDTRAVINSDKNSSFLNYDFTKTKESIKRSSDLLERRTM